MWMYESPSVNGISFHVLVYLAKERTSSETSRKEKYISSTGNPFYCYIVLANMVKGQVNFIPFSGNAYFLPLHTQPIPYGVLDCLTS